MRPYRMSLDDERREESDRGLHETLCRFLLIDFLFTTNLTNSHPYSQLYFRVGNASRKGQALQGCNLKNPC